MSSGVCIPVRFEVCEELSLVGLRCVDGEATKTRVENSDQSCEPLV